VGNWWRETRRAKAGGVKTLGCVGVTKHKNICGKGGDYSRVW